MNWAWAVGILILSIVPGIIGGGLFWQFFEQWTAVIVWEVILFCIVMLIIAKGMRLGTPAHH